jgi:large subunit ribosomal protein L21
MFAVIKTGGKQYKVAPGDIIRVEKLAGDVGRPVALDQVLMIGDGKGIAVGTPVIEGASVSAEVLGQTRGEKIIVFKKKRRKGYRRTQGHRQDLTVLRITDIHPTGASKKAPAKPEPAETPAVEAKAPVLKPAEEKAEETAAKEAKPAEKKAEEAAAKEAKPAEKKAKETAAKEAKPAEKKAKETAAKEAKPAPKKEAKPAAKKPGPKKEAKPAAKKTAAKPGPKKTAAAKKAAKAGKPRKEKS